GKLLDPLLVVLRRGTMVAGEYDEQEIGVVEVLKRPVATVDTRQVEIRRRRTKRERLRRIHGPEHDRQQERRQKETEVGLHARNVCARSLRAIRASVAHKNTHARPNVESVVQPAHRGARSHAGAVVTGYGTPSGP